MKLIYLEAESGALERWLAERPDVPWISSELAKVEVVRACRRLDGRTMPAARALVAGLDLVPMTGGVVDLAAELEPADLRSLDALHLASALTVGLALTAFVVYDHRLADAARAAGLDPVTP